MSFKIKGDCSFIDEFLDFTVNLPREIVRLLKLIKEVDEKSNEINLSLQENRKKYLSSMENNQIINHELFKQINEQNTNAISLCDYKKEVVKELQYLLFHFYMDKLNNVIEQGEKECKDQQINSTILTQNNFNHSFSNYYDKSNDGDYSSTISGIQHGNKKKINSYHNSEMYHNSNNTTNNKILGYKTRRTPKLKNNKKSNNSIELSESDMTQSQQINENINQEPIYCKCKKQRDDLKMICCDNPKCKIQWFHCECMHVSPSDEEKEWFCSEECRKQAKEERKKKKKNH